MKYNLQQFLSSEKSPQLLIPSHKSFVDTHFPLSQRLEPFIKG